MSELPIPKRLKLAVNIIGKIFLKKGDKSIKKYLGNKYDEFLELYGKTYDDIVDNLDFENFNNLKKVSTRKISADIRRDAVKAGYLDYGAGQKAIQMMRKSPFKQRIANYKDKQGPVLQQKIDSYKVIVDDIIREKGTIKKKDKKTGEMVEYVATSTRDFGFNKVLPRLKEKFPKIYEDMVLDVYPGGPNHFAFDKFIKSQVTLPKTLQNKASYANNLVYNTFKKYRVDKQKSFATDIDSKFIFDIFRSRPKDLRTGNMVEDVDMFFHFLDDVNYFNPISENFYKKTDPDFLGYKAYRDKQKKQPKGTHLSHTLHTVVPDPFFETRMFDDLPTVEKIKAVKFKSPNKYMSDAVPFSGADPDNLTLLPGKVNMYKQPNLESQIYIELQKPLESRSTKLLQNLEQQMIDKKIRTRIVDPITGDERPYGYMGKKSTGYFYADGGIASIEEVLEYNDG